MRAEFPDILFYVQKSAWFDNVTCDAWLDGILLGFSKSGPHLLCLDNLGGHVSTSFRNIAWKNSPRVHLVYTPADCTDACAVTDDGLRLDIKRDIRKKFLLHFQSHIEDWQGKNGLSITASDRRHLYSGWLSESIKSFYDPSQASGNDSDPSSVGYTRVRKSV